MVERINSIVSQTFQCLTHDLKNERIWKRMLSMVEMSINSLPNRATGYSPFFLNYDFHLVAPIQLLDTHTIRRFEVIYSFVDQTQ